MSMVILRGVLDGMSVFRREIGVPTDAEVMSLETGLACRDPSLAVQSSAEECDINTIVRRFGITGQMPVHVRPMLAGDFDEVFDYQTAQNALVAADRSFMALPAELRARFSNSPQRFLEFCSDESNLPELRKLGLANPVVEPVAPKEPVAPVEPKP